MKKIHLTSLALLLGASVAAGAATAQAPVITLWRLNLDGATGSSPDTRVNNAINTLSADVREVGYDATDVYIRASTIPSHSVGPFRDRNPNLPDDNNIVFRIPRNPRPATTKVATSLGPIGVCANGVPIFNALDARSYFNRGIWNQNANVVEAPGFDDARGHPARRNGTNGLYHYHQRPSFVLQQQGETGGAKHSPILGYSFDGYPIYGPYGYANTNGTGGITRIRSSYRLRSITVRQRLPNGQNLNPADYGPPVSSVYPLGYYVEDFEYVRNLGELDEYNGRFAVTPEYPAGTYAYYATVDASGDAAYPYLIGPQYYGIPTNNRRVRWPAGLTAYTRQLQVTGAGCSGASLSSSGGNPTVPNPNFALVSETAPANGAVVYFLTARLSPTVVDVFGCPLLVNLTTPTITLGGATNAQGRHDLALPIPQNASLIGVAVHGQHFATNFQSTTTSNALTLLIK